MRVAAIDMGSNSFHMLIAETRGPRSFEPVVQDKMMIQVGRTALVTGRLDGETMRRALDCLVEFRRIALSRRVERTLVAATSAIREAENGGEFLKRAREVSGLPVRAITGREEARLIHLAVTRHVPLGDERAFLVDIGGGSVELAVGDSTRLFYATSRKLGFLRMQGRFITSDPIRPDEEAQLREHIRQELARPMALVRRARPQRVIATSGSATTLLRLAQQARGRKRSRDLTDGEVSREEIGRLLSEIARVPHADRIRRFDLDPMRAAFLPTAAITLACILDEAGLDKFLVCPVALREGLIYDFLARSTASIPGPEPSGDLRYEAVLDLARRCDYQVEHSHRVAALAVQIFRETSALHGLGTEDENILRYAAVLHDIGYHISYTKHHRHGHYLVMNCDLRGFTPDERLLVAALVRYHRRALPKKSQPELACLAPPAQRTVRRLTAIIRIADALDRSHYSIVEQVRCRLAPGRARFEITTVETYPKTALDLEHVRRHARYFEHLHGVAASFVVRRRRPTGSGEVASLEET